MKLVLLSLVLSGALFYTTTAVGQPQPAPGEVAKGDGAIPFEVFAGFQRIEKGNPIFALRPPLWAAATHALVVGDIVHYYWCKRDLGRRWLIMHATAPFISAAPRPKSSPSRTTGSKGSDVQLLRLPGGTTSV